ncbi:MAG: DNA repair protein [Clostridia bacterium]|nr:DNA repair protein [Clostridia bacterium]
MQKMYLCIDLKSFYASVECVERGLDPMTENLVVADPERSDKTICLAISPAMKKLGVKNRCRVFEIPKNIKYVMAVPRMQLYIDYAAEIYGIYLDYVSKDDIYVYSIDEVFIDITNYIRFYKKTEKEIAKMLMQAVFDKTGVRAACGIGTNMYLCKIALDITAKHSDDFIGYLDEELYRKTLWDYTPITDFWRIGAGTANRLKRYGINTMGEIAKADEDLLYRIFGIDAELLIDHAWGREPVGISEIKKYKPKTNSLTSGQVLMHDYTFSGGELIVREMTELLCLDMTKKNLVTKSVSLRVGYSNRENAPAAYGSFSLETETNLDKILIPAVSSLYKKIVNPDLLVRRVNISFNNIKEEKCVQIGLFDNTKELEKNKKIQTTMLKIKERFGKNAVIKGMNLEEGATTIERNRQIGGHKSG